MDIVIAGAAIWMVVNALWAYWGVTVAQYKGRDAGLGFVLGMALGPLGVMLAWLLPPNEDVMWSRRALWEKTHLGTHTDIREFRQRAAND